MHTFNLYNKKSTLGWEYKNTWKFTLDALKSILKVGLFTTSNISILSTLSLIVGYIVLDY